MSHYSMGFDDVSHKGKVIRTTVGNAKADSYVELINNKKSTAYTYIPNGLEHRPDLLANQLYYDANKLWLVCLSSNKFDVFEDFNVGSKIGLI